MYFSQFICGEEAQIFEGVYGVETEPLLFGNTQDENDTNENDQSMFLDIEMTQSVSREYSINLKAAQYLESPLDAFIDNSLPPGIIDDGDKIRRQSPSISSDEEALYISPIALHIIPNEPHKEIEPETFSVSPQSSVSNPETLVEEGEGSVSASTPQTDEEQQKLNLKVNSNESNFACPACGKDFGNRRDRDRHILAHHTMTAEKRGITKQIYHCRYENCRRKKGFTRYDNLLKHYTRKHGRAKVCRRTRLR